MRCFWMLAFFLLFRQLAVAQCRTEPVTLYLLSDFAGDQVKVLVDGKLVYNKVLTTDHSTGVAGWFTLKRVASRQKISLLVNGILLNTTWLDPAAGCMYGYGFSKMGYFVDTQYYPEPPMFD